MEHQDHTLPEGQWQFNDEVTQVFDEMLRRSIPQHEVMRQTVFDLGSTFVKPQTDIVDLGCSRGEALSPFVDRFGANNRFVGVEISAPMLEAARARFEGYRRAGVVDIRDCDLTETFPACRASLILSVLTIQFTPIEYRQGIIQEIYNHLIPGGAFIMVEKMLGANAEIDKLLVDRYYQMKRENGYSQEEIDRKRFSLRGALVPVTADWNVELLRQAGFHKVDCVWRWCNFGAFLAVKDG